VNTLLKILTGLLLVFNGTGALYGGGNLILHPDGSSIQLSAHWLEHTPFPNYLIPGIVLFIANGLFSLYVLICLLVNNRHYPWLVIAQGVILSGWIIIQVLLIRTVYFLHIILGLVGVALMLLGRLQMKKAGIHAA
jgi:hypothetical protein